MTSRDGHLLLLLPSLSLSLFARASSRIDSLPFPLSKNSRCSRNGLHLNRDFETLPPPLPFLKSLFEGRISMARSEGEPGARKGNFATYGLDAREGGGNHRRGDDNRKDRDESRLLYLECDSKCFFHNSRRRIRKNRCFFYSRSFKAVYPSTKNSIYVFTISSPPPSFGEGSLKVVRIVVDRKIKLISNTIVFKHSTRAFKSGLEKLFKFFFSFFFFFPSDIVVNRFLYD